MAGDGGAGPSAERRWEVALSFAGPQRPYVERVAATLKARGVRVFYDADEMVRLWGKGLAEELTAVYAEQAGAVVVFVSADYATREWPRVERRAALGRAARERREYVLPARFDDTTLPELADRAYVDLRGLAPEAFADIVAAKLTELGNTPPPAVPAGNSAGEVLRGPVPPSCGVSDGSASVAAGQRQDPRPVRPKVAKFRLTWRARWRSPESGGEPRRVSGDTPAAARAQPSRPPNPPRESERLAARPSGPTWRAAKPQRERWSDQQLFTHYMVASAWCFDSTGRRNVVMSNAYENEAYKIWLRMQDSRDAGRYTGY
jgi:hypothetical protein